MRWPWWFAGLLFCAAPGGAQAVLPERTAIMVRLEETISSAKARAGQAVRFSLAEDVRAGDTLVMAAGAPCAGTIVEAVARRRTGRTGSLAFAVHQCTAVDGRPVILRSARRRKEGGSDVGRTAALAAVVGVLSIGIPVAAPAVLMRRGKDVEVMRGVTLEVSTGQAFVLRPE